MNGSGRLSPTIRVYQPPRGVHGPSGGDRYNAEVVKRLERDGRSGCREVEPERLLTELERQARNCRGETVHVFDSLYMTRIGAPERLAGVAGLGETRLLLHYLPSMNPRLAARQRRDLAELERRWIEAVGGVITTSSLIAQHVFQASARAISRVARPGVEAFFRPADEAERVPLGGPGAGRPVEIVCVGNLQEDKGQLLLVRMLAGIAERPQPFRLVLIGELALDPEYTAAVRAAARGLELELTGSLSPEQVAARLRGADLFVSASLFEAYGMASAEAVASGLPVLAYRTGEIEEWVCEGQNGFLFEVGDEAGLAGKLGQLLARPAELEGLRDGRGVLFPTWEHTYEHFVTACAPARIRDCADGAEGGSIELYAECELPTEFGEFQVKVFRTGDGEEAILFAMGELGTGEPPFVRVHSECFTGEVLHSLRCDCREQLLEAMSTIAERQRGAIVYLRQEGRGIGLGNKIRAYAEQSKGADTIEANEILGFPSDLRDFRTAALMLAEAGIPRIQLHTNNPDKVDSLRAHGIVIERVIPSISRPNPHNLGYIETKYRNLGHVGLLSSLRRAALD